MGYNIEKSAVVECYFDSGSGSTGSNPVRSAKSRRGYYSQACGLMERTPCHFALVASFKFFGEYFCIVILYIINCNEVGSQPDCLGGAASPVRRACPTV